MLKSKSSYFSRLILPLASFIDQLHESANILTESYDYQKYFLCSIHVLIWLKISVLIGVLSMIALASPTFYLVDEYQREMSFMKQQKVPIKDVVFNIPTGNYVAWFIFFEVFTLVHMLLILIGLWKKMPLFFAPSQIILFLWSIKLSWDLGYDLYISANNFFNRLFDIKTNDYGVISVTTFESNLAFISNAELRLVFSAMTKVIMIVLVLFAQLIIERSMQWYNYEGVVADIKNYSVIIANNDKLEHQRDLELFWIKDTNQTWCCECPAETSMLNFSSTFKKNNNFNVTCKF